MHHLAKLSPAETLIILEGYSVPLKDLLKYTLMDLFLKKVLKTTRKNYQPDPKARIIVQTYVSPGANFQNYKGLVHESVFLNTFKTNPSIKLLFRNAVQIGYQKSESKRAYHDFVVSNLSITSYITQNAFQRFFGRYSISEAGLKLRTALKAELKDLEQILPGLTQNDQRKVLEIIAQIKGNIFLLKNFDFKLLHQIDADIAHAMNKEKEYDGATCGTGGSFSCSTWSDFDHHSHSFDVSCGSGGDWGSSCGNSCGSSCGSSCGGGCGGGD